EELSEREEARMSTVINLLAIGRPSVEILIEYLEDDDWLIREAAADLLGKIGDIRAVEPLMRRLQVDQDTGVKELAMPGLPNSISRLFPFDRCGSMPWRPWPR